MNKYALTILMACSFLTTTAGHGAILPIPLTDPPQAVQTALNDIQSAAKYTQQQANTIVAFKTRVANGYAGLQRFANTDNLKRMFEQKLTMFGNKQLGNVFDGDEFRKLVGNDIASKFNMNDLSNMDLDKLKQLGMGQAGNLTQDQIKDILGADLANKLTESQIRALLDNPKGLSDFLSGSGAQAVQVQQASASNQALLNLVEAPKDVFKKKAAAAESATPNGNRSDAFGGTGNGSTPQAQAALDSFKAIQEKIILTTQIPIGGTPKSLTPENIESVRKIQVKTEEITAISGLSTAWLRQTLRTRSMPEQEQEAEKKLKEAKDNRESIRVISYVTLIGVEAQNNANEIFAENLKVFAAQTTQRVGNTSGQTIDGITTGTTSDTTTGTTAGGTNAGAGGTTATPAGGTTTGATK